VIKGKQRRLILGLVLVEVLICLAIVTVLLVVRSEIGPLRFFYFANTRVAETLEERFTVDGPVTLDLSNTSGEVQVTGGDRNEIVVRAIKEAWGQNKKDAQAKLQAMQVEMGWESDTLRIKVEDPEENAAYIGVFYSGHSNQVRFEITVPRQTGVVAYTHNGRITLQDTEGDANLTNRYEPIVVEGVAANVTVEARNGDVTVLRSGSAGTTASLTSRYGTISVEGVAGDITVDARNGDVTVLRSGDEEAVLNLVSYYGRITTRQVIAGDLTLDSHNGALTLEDVVVGGDLELEAYYGKTELDGVQAGSLKVNGKNGDIVLKDVRLDGTLDLFTHYGAVSVTGSEAGAYKIETQNGAIKLDGGRGSVWLHSHYGDIEVKAARDVTLDLSTDNGKVAFEGSLSNTADHTLESDYGAVTLRLPPDTSVLLDASTDHGRIRCDFDVLVRGADKEENDASGDELRGAINDGSARLQIRTRNGDIVLEKEPSE
jgi:DUF4097 and DUF4098 domain-containing protein YvlB